MADETRRKPFRRLAPRPAPTASSSRVSSPPITSSARSAGNRACQSCRQRKVKCDAKQPHCGACLATGRSCVYPIPRTSERFSRLERDNAELRHRLASHENLYNLLKARPANQIAEIVATLPCFNEVEVGTLNNGNDDSPNAASSGAIAGRARDGAALTFAAGMHGMPGTPDQGHDHSQFPPHRRLTSKYDHPKHIFEEAWHSSPNPHLEDSIFVHLSESSLPVAQWTSVSNDNKLLNHLLQLFWAWDTIVNLTIDRTMFEEDLRHLDPGTNTTDPSAFCSPFLVNALLAAACLYTTNETTFADSGNPVSRGAEFAREARRLFPLEMGTPSLTLAQGLGALVLYEGCLGKATVAMNLFDRLYDAYERLNLDDWPYEPVPAEATGSGRANRVIQALSWIHWGFYIFEWKSCIALCRRKRIPRPKRAQLWRYEATSLLSKPETADYWWFAYPISLVPQESPKRQLFVAEHELVLIVEDVLILLAPIEGELAPHENVKTAIDLYNALVSWRLSLPPSLQLESSTHPGVLLLHANYNTILISLLRPFDDMSLEEFGPFVPKSASYQHASSMMTALWTYRALYTARHEYWPSYLCSVSGFRVLHDLAADPFRMETFTKACQILHELSERFPLAADVLSAIQGAVDQHNVQLPFTTAKWRTITVANTFHTIMQQTVIPVASIPADSSRGHLSTKLYKLRIADLCREVAPGASLD